MTEYCQAIEVKNLAFNYTLHEALSHSLDMHEAIDLKVLGFPYEGLWLVTEIVLCGDPFSLQFKARETEGKDLAWEPE